VQSRGGRIQGEGLLSNADQTGAIFHGVPGVGAKIDDDLVDLSRIAEDGADARLEVGDDPHFVRQGGPDEFHRVVHDGLEKNQFALVLLLAGKSEDLLDDFLGAETGFEDFLDVFGGGVGVTQFQFCKIAVAENDAEDVVEFMGRAAGQRAEGFHFLGLAQLFLKFRALFLGPFALADILELGHEMARRAIGVPSQGDV